MLYRKLVDVPPSGNVVILINMQSGYGFASGSLPGIAATMLTACVDDSCGVDICSLLVCELGDKVTNLLRLSVTLQSSLLAHLGAFNGRQHTNSHFGNWQAELWRMDRLPETTCAVLHLRRATLDCKERIQGCGQSCLARLQT